MSLKKTFSKLGYYSYIQFSFVYMAYYAKEGKEKSKQKMHFVKVFS